MSDSVDLVAQLGGELVTYTPHGGVAKIFKAIVERRPTQVEHVGGLQYGANTLEIAFPRDAVNGVLTVQARKDRVRFKKQLSDMQETDFTVQTILEEDAGLFVTDGGLFRVMVQA